MTVKFLTKYFCNTNTDKWSVKDQNYFFSNLSDLLRMGFSIKNCLEFLQVVHPSDSKRYQEFVRKLSGGESFPKTLRPVISEDTYYQILVADQHGDLVDALGNLGNLNSMKTKQRKQILALLEYPMFLVGFLIVMMVGMKIFIAPELASMGGTDNSLTQKLFNFALVVMIFLFSIVGLIGFQKYHNYSLINRINVICRLPVIGKTYQTYCHYYFAFNLAYLIESGMALGEICELLMEYNRNSIMFQIGKELKRRIWSGSNPNKFIKQNIFLPRELELFFQKGNEPKKLGQELRAFSNMKYQELVRRMESLIMLIQPILFGIVGIIIVGMYLSILLPMYGSMKEVTG